jgi:hypothetical protein
MSSIDLTLRSRFSKQIDQALKDSLEAIPRLVADPSLLERAAANHPTRRGLTAHDVLHALEIESVEFRQAHYVLRGAKTIVVAAEQAAIFQQTVKSYFDGLEYKLPFPHIFLQFSQPIPITTETGPDALSCLLLNQVKVTEENLDYSHQQVAMRKRIFPSTMIVPEQIKAGETINHVIAVFTDFNVRRISWPASGEMEMYEEIDQDVVTNAWRTIKNLAIGCIGYINCENIYLEKQGGASEKANRKRAASGKPQLEPYYVCKIRGVDYNAGHSESHSGRSVGFRFDIRGHFRKLPTGKVTWVRPHQRGLQHELYVPKSYVVDRPAPAAPDSKKSDH